MDDLIKRTLEESGINSSYIKRPDNVFPCIVYSYNEYTNAKGDGKEENVKYDIYFNLYIKSGLNSALKKIKESLAKNGFIKQVINAPIQFDGLDYYQITMNYTKLYKERID